MPCHATHNEMQVYTIYSILFIVFIILIIVTAFITVALTYFQILPALPIWGLVHTRTHTHTAAAVEPRVCIAFACAAVRVLGRAGGLARHAPATPALVLAPELAVLWLDGPLARPQVVVALFLVRRLHRHLCVRLLLLPLPRTLRHVGLHAGGPCGLVRSGEGAGDAAAVLIYIPIAVLL